MRKALDEQASNIRRWGGPAKIPAKNSDDNKPSSVSSIVRGMDARGPTCRSRPYFQRQVLLNVHHNQSAETFRRLVRALQKPVNPLATLIAIVHIIAGILSFSGRHHR